MKLGILVCAFIEATPKDRKFGCTVSSTCVYVHKRVGQEYRILTSNTQQMFYFELLDPEILRNTLVTRRI